MSDKNLIALKNFAPSRWPIRFDIPFASIVICEAWEKSNSPGLVCLVVGWRDHGHYEWLIYDAAGIKCHQFSSAGFGSPEAARREGLRILVQHGLEITAEAGKETAAS